MKFHTFTLAAVALVGLAWFALPTLPSHAGGGEWEVLFNGQDLTGWKYYGDDLSGKKETKDGRFTVKENVIVAEEGKGIKDLYTSKSFDGNFHLKLEFRAAPKADSGVYVRGIQLQVRDYQRRKERNLKKFKDDDWNELDIVVKNNQIVSKLNGKELSKDDMLELTVKGDKVVTKVNGKEVSATKIDVTETAIAHCLCNGEFLENMPIPNKSDKGVGLQAETGKFEFRNVKIKKLP